MADTVADAVGDAETGAGVPGVPGPELLPGPVALAAPRVVAPPTPAEPGQVGVSRVGPPPAFGPFAEPSSPHAVPPGSRSSGLLLAAAWTASLLVLVAIGFVLVTERRAVVAAWPPAGRLYAVLGLRAAAQGGGG